MKVVVSFEDRDYKYEIEMQRLMQLLGVKVSDVEIQEAVRKALLTQ